MAAIGRAVGHGIAWSIHSTTALQASNSNFVVSTKLPCK